MAPARWLRDVTRRIRKRPTERTSEEPAQPRPQPPPSSSNVGVPGFETSTLDPWARAWNMFVERESELATAYKGHLRSLSQDGDTNSRTSSQLAQSTVEQLLKQRESKQWSVSLFGKDVKVRTEAEKLVKILLWSDGVVKTALSAQPYAALAWSGVSILLPLLNSSTAQHAALLQGFTSITHVQLYWKIWEDEPGNDLANVQRDTRTTLADLYSHVLEYQARAICHLSSSQSSRAWQQIAGDNDWEGKAAEVETRSKHCRELVGLSEDGQTRKRWEAQLQEIHQSRTILEDIHAALRENAANVERHREDGITRDLLHALQADHEAYKNFNRTRVDGTCEWFFGDERFLEWRDSTGPSIIWVSAGPGCGKSVLARSLIDERRLSATPATTTVCHFFFKDGYERRNDASNALAAILHQIFIQSSTSHLIAHAAQSFRNHGKALANSFDELWSILTECAKLPDAGQIICVLDALDECNPYDRHRIIRALRSFYLGAQPHSSSCPSSSQSRLKFLVTSRPYDDLEASFESLSGAGAYIRFDGDERSENIRREIDLVIDDWVSRYGKDFSSEHCQRIATRLKAKENRTYLWLHLTLSIIEQSPSAYSKSSSIERLLSELPSGVLDAYDTILSRSPEVTLTKALLHIVLVATRPMMLDEVNWALTLQEPGYSTLLEVEENLWPCDMFKSTVKNLCGLFIGVFEGEVSFIHQTAREFLTMSPVSGRTWQGCSPMQTAHSTMTLTCMRLASLVSASYSECPDDISFGNEPIISDKDQPFAMYAVTNWDLHYNRQDEYGKGVLLEHAREMCRVSERRQWPPLPNTKWELCIDSMDKYLLWKWMEKSTAQWTDLTYASFLGLTRVVAAIVTQEKVDVDSQGGPCGTALTTAAARGHLDTVRTLLERGADVNAPGGVYRTALVAAASQGHQDVLELLFDAGHEHPSTEDDALAALNSNRCPPEMFQMLWGKGGSTLELTERVLIAIAQNSYGAAIFALLFESRASEIDITNKVLTAAAQNFIDGPGVVRRLLKEKGSSVDIKEAVLTAAAQNAHKGDQILRLLLEHAGVEVEVTEEVLTAAARNSRTGARIMRLLLEQAGGEVEITERVMIAAAQNLHERESVMSLLLEQAGGEVEITEEVLIAAAGNYRAGHSIMSLLLEQAGGEVEVTERVLIAAAGNYRARGCIMSLLLKRSRRRQLGITEQVLIVAAQDWNEGDRMVRLLLEQTEGELPITKDVVVAAAWNPGIRMETLNILAEKGPSGVDMAREIDEAAAAGWIGEADEQREEWRKEMVSNAKRKLGL